MSLIKDFRDFAMRGNVIDLAVGVIIGAAFGRITTSLVEDIVMPPLGKLLGNLDFSNLYISLSDKIDAANMQRLTSAAQAATQPANAMPGGITGSVASLLDTSSRLPLAEAKKLGPVIAWGNFVTISINFLLVALVIFLVIRALAAARARFEREQKLEAAAPAVPPADVQLLTEIRDLLKSRT